MTKVQMLVHITGGRADGNPWPAAGGPLVVSKDEANDLYVAQLARPWPGGEDPEPEPEPVPESAPVETAAVEAPAEQWPPAEPGRMGVVPHVPEPVAEPAVEEDGPPRPGAAKATWVAWAVSQGASDQEANEATKQELMEKYGARP